MTPQPHSSTVRTADFDSADDGSNPSVAAILSELATLGWLFNNCYQHDDGTWRINLRRPDEKGDWFTSWAEAPTFYEAIEDCMSKLQDAEFFDTPEANYSIAKPETGSLLSRLGLSKPTPQYTGEFKRRV